MAADGHKWTFYRCGGVDQVVLQTGADLAHLDELDQKLWVALACPVKGLSIDERTLELLDLDKDGRIRTPEIVAVVRWMREALKDLGDLYKGGDRVLLSALNDKSEVGAALLSGARRVLHNLGRPDADAITLADVTDTTRIFASTTLNGDGIIPPDAAADEETRAALVDIMATCGSVIDRADKPGVNLEIVERFFTGAEALHEWHAAAEADPTILVLGPATAAAAAAAAAVKGKIDDFFTRGHLAELDPRAAAAMNGAEGDFAALAQRDLSVESPDVARLPVARIEAERDLPLVDGLNPAWAGAVRTFARAAVTPLLGPRTSLSEADWQALQALLSGYVEWEARRPATDVGKLDIGRVRQLLLPGLRERIVQRIEQDAALAPENAQLVEIEKLIRCQRDLVELLRNYVNFADFYGLTWASFQVGTLYLDGRACDLCVRADDAARHAALAGLAKISLAYCDCVRGAEKMTIAAAFTDGDSDGIIVGRNGVFFDRQGRDWDATITKLIENPISIREAFFSPYKRFVRFVEEQVAKRAAGAEADTTAQLQAAAAATAAADKTQSSDPKAKAQPKKIDVGTVAALGVAVGGIVTFFSTVLSMFVGLGWYLPLGLLALVLCISGPSMLVAWLKLRQRNLGPLLDANSWAVNTRARINVPFGQRLTRLATLPPGSQRLLTDPFAEKRRPWALLLVLAAALGLLYAWYRGALDGPLPEHIRRSAVLGPLPSDPKVAAEKQAQELAAVEKQAKERAAAAEKKAEERAAAAEKKAEERAAAAERKAEERAAAAEKQAQERAAERAAAEKQAQERQAQERAEEARRAAAKRPPRKAAPPENKDPATAADPPAAEGKDAPAP